MTALQSDPRVDPLLTAEILTHLNTQLASARRMLAVVLEQATAIRQRAIPNIVRLAGSLQAEMHRREVIEIERHELIERAGSRLAVGSADVTIAMLTTVMDEDSAQIARNRTAELRDMLEDIRREHQTNRALMQQELAFLDHLLRLAGGAGGYDSAGERVSAKKRNRAIRQPVFDLDA
jgi:hypothetical protein